MRTAAVVALLIAVGASLPDAAGQLTTPGGLTWFTEQAFPGGGEPDPPLSARYGESVAVLGDMDGDGTIELAVGASRDGDVVGLGTGAVHILSIAPDGSLQGWQKISQGVGGFTGVLEDEDLFGSALAAPGDVDGDGVADLAVGAWGDDDGAFNAGAVWILFLDTDGTVQGHAKISNLSGGFGSPLGTWDRLGRSLTALGDFDGDGTPDIAAGTAGDGGYGAVWILRLTPAGTVSSANEIGANSGLLAGLVAPGDIFAASLASPGDMDGDGVRDVLVGAPYDGPFSEAGAVWRLLLNADGSLQAADPLSVGGAFTPAGNLGWRFGLSIAGIGDLDGDGVEDLAVGGYHEKIDHKDTEPHGGELYVLLMNADYSVKSFAAIEDPPLPLGEGDWFGSSVALLGDIDADGLPELAVGAPKSWSFPIDDGDLWLLSVTDGHWVHFEDVEVSGVAGDPVLQAAGAPVPGETVSLELRDAAPSTTTLLVVGASSVWVFHAGGFLVPAPDVIIPLPTDASGRLVVSGPWPPGVPPDSEIFFQFWTSDAAAVGGYSASSAAGATIP